MRQNEFSGRWTLVGTVFGQGYDCKKDKDNTFEDSKDGLWNKVSQHMEWIEKEMGLLGQIVCRDA